MECSPAGSSVHGDFPGKNTGVGCHALLLGIFPTQGSNPRLLCLLHCRQISAEPSGKPHASWVGGQRGSQFSPEQPLLDIHGTG